MSGLAWTGGVCPFVCAAGGGNGKTGPSRQTRYATRRKRVKGPPKSPVTRLILEPRKALQKDAPFRVRDGIRAQAFRYKDRRLVPEKKK